MTKHKKVYFLIVLFIFLFYLVLNYITLSAPEWNKEEANSYDHMCDDCILYVQKNGLHSFPFVFGQSLYMYCIDTGEKNVIHRELWPGARLIDNYTIYHKYVIYEKRDFTGGPSGLLEIKDVEQGLTRRVNLSECEFAIKDGCLYSCDNEGICATRIGDGTTKLVIPRKDELSYYCEVRIEEDWLITQDEYYGSLILKNLETGSVYEIDRVQDDFYSETTILDNKQVFAVLGESGDLIEINLETGEKKLVTNINKHTYEILYNLGGKNNFIYFNNQDGDIFAINIMTKEKMLIIDLSKTIGHEINRESILLDDFLVHYGDEHIFIERQFSEDGYDYPLKEILVFDYNGELVVKERVIQ